MMPRIKEYFAPDKRIAPSEKGFEAAQALARSQEALGSSGERTAEAWVQAARRLGTLGTETAQLVAQNARLKAQGIEGLRGLGHAEAGTVNRSPPPTMKGDPLKILHDAQRASAASSQEVLRAAAATFSDGTKYPVDPTTGQPFSAQSWELYQRTRQLNSEEAEDKTKAANNQVVQLPDGTFMSRNAWQNSAGSGIILISNTPTSSTRAH